MKHHLYALLNERVIRRLFVLIPLRTHNRVACFDRRPNRLNIACEVDILGQRFFLLMWSNVLDLVTASNKPFLKAPCRYQFALCFDDVLV